MRPASALATALFLCSCGILFSQTTAAPPASSVSGVQVSVPRLIRISGSISSDGQPRTSGMTFAVYSYEVGGSALWQEVQNVTLDAAGHYSVLLGSSTSDGLPLDLFASGEGRWLGVRVEQEPEQPRTLLVAVPYALKAADAETLGGKPASSFVTTEQLSSGPGISSSGVQTSTVSGGTPLAANVTGSGSQNMLPKFDSSGTNLINSQLFDDGTHVGFGTQSPAFQFDEQNSDASAAGAQMFRIQTPSVNGATMHFISTSTNGRHFGFGSNFIIGNGEFGIYDYTANLNRFLIAGNGNIGIGTNTPQFNFDLQNSDATATGANIFRLRTPSVNGAVMHFQSTSANGHDWAFGSNFISGAGEFGVYDYTAGASRIFITAGGNIGIDTTSPGATFDVAGNLKVRSGGITFPDNSVQSTASAGTISGVMAGTGLTGGGTNGTVTLNMATPVAIANGGTGLSSPGGAGTYLRSNGSTLQSSTIQTGDLPATVAMTGSPNTFTVGQTINGSGTALMVNGSGAGSVGVQSTSNDTAGVGVQAQNTAGCTAPGANAGCGKILNANDGVNDVLSVDTNGLQLKSPIVARIDNDTATGTTSNLLVKLSTGGKGVITATGDLGGAIGVAGFNAGKVGKSWTATIGVTNCLFDNQTAVADYAVIGTAGQCHDAGAAYPSGVQVLGRVLGVNAGPGAMTQLYLFGTEARGVGPDKLTIAAVAFSGFSQTNDVVFGQGNISPQSNTAFTNCGGFTGNNCDLMFQYAGMIKSLDGNALVVAPEISGWLGYELSPYDVEYGESINFAQSIDTFPDRKTIIAAGGNDYAPWLLGQFKQYADAHQGQRLLDIFAVHYYPQGGNNNTNTRSLWDPNFLDPSFINDKIMLIPRMKQWVANNYPGTKIGVTEYNWGSINDEINADNMSYAVTQADVLGIFAREGLDLATRFNAPPKLDVMGKPLPTYNALKMYRNYDGNKSTFGDVSTSATVPNPDTVAAFSAQRTSDGSLTVMILSKYQAGNTPATVTLANFMNNGPAHVWQLSGSGTAIQQLADIPLNNAALNLALPPQSITLLVIPSATNQPKKRRSQLTSQ